MKLYHYTTIESFAKIWMSQQIRFSPYKKMNDLLEIIKTWQLVKGSDFNGDFSDESKKCDVSLRNFSCQFTKELSKYRQISFSLDSREWSGYASPLMWGHYAKNENGVCIELESDGLDLKGIECKKVVYTNKIPTLTFSQDDINSHFSFTKFIQSYKDRIFFTKHKSWEHENEYRMVCRVDNKDTKFFLPIQNAVNRVFVYQDNGINTDIIDRIIDKDVEICSLIISHVGGYCHVSSYKPSQYNKPYNIKI